MRLFRTLTLLLLLVAACREQPTSQHTSPGSPAPADVPFLIPPRYAAALSFSCGVAAAADDRTIGYIDRAGNWLPAVSHPRPLGDPTKTQELSDLEKMMLLDPGSIFPGAQPFKVGEINLGELVLKARDSSTAMTLKSFNEDLAPHEVNETYGFRNKTGKYVIKLEYHDARGFSEGLAAVQIDHEWGYINATGNVMIAPQFVEAGDFHDGLAIVRLSFKGYGFIDRTGKIVIPTIYEKANHFSEGRALVLTSTGFGFIDRAGKEVIPPRYHFAGDFSEGLAAFCPGQCDERSGEKGYIGVDDEYAINPSFEEARRFGSGLAPVKQNGKWGYIRHDGTFAINPQFDDAQPFRDKLAIVSIAGGKTFITTSGARPIDAVFTELEPYSEGVALACRDGKCGFLKQLNVPGSP